VIQSENITAINVQLANITKIVNGLTARIDELGDAVNGMNEIQNKVIHIISNIASPKPHSTSTERALHLVDFKNRLAREYERFVDSNPNVIKCMVLDHPFSADQVVAGHLISINQIAVWSALNLTAEMVWDRRNGILHHNDIEKKYSSMEVVRMVFILYPYTFNLLLFLP
jgi:hypothetical protein